MDTQYEELEAEYESGRAARIREMRYRKRRQKQLRRIITVCLVFGAGALAVIFLMGFSLLSMLEFLIRETETCETINHLLRGWRQIVVQKNHLSVIIELFRLLQ